MANQSLDIRPLPRNASFEHVKKQAKTLHKSLTSSHEARECVARYFDTPEQVSLQQVQLVVAREYGFESWVKLKQQIPIAGVLAEQSEKHLAESILKTHRHEDIERFLIDAAKKTLGWQSISIFRFELSVGAAFGLQNDSGDRCLLKVLGPDDFGAEVRRDFQSWLGQQNFPCPRVLVPLTKHGGLRFIIEEYLDKGRRADGHIAADRKLMAEKLYDLIRLSREYPDLKEMPTDTLVEVPGSAWPKPHNVYFDFAATEAGAEWINEAGARTKPLLDAMKDGDVIAHMDWSAKHFLVAEGEVSAIFDWDSVARVTETRAVGAAAAVHTYSQYIDKPNRPSLPQIESFLSDYQQFRGVPFSDRELSQVWAALVYTAAYGARCEHAIDHANPGEDARLLLKSLIDHGLPGFSG